MKAEDLKESHRLWDKLSDEEKMEEYNWTIGQVDCCCSPTVESFESADGICPECGRVTSKGECVAGCYYSSEVCETCGARPCDGSC